MPVARCAKLHYRWRGADQYPPDSPLATNLSYAVGQAEITVPNVPTGSNYIVVRKYSHYCFVKCYINCPRSFRRLW
jgi:hypothetical protein